VKQVKFTVYAKPVPQGSMRGFVVKGKWGAKDRAVLTSDNSKLKPFRGEVTREAMVALRDAGLSEPMAEKHVPVSLVIDFYFQRPASTPKKRKEMVVRPDADKCIRGLLDSLTGVIYADDAQVVEISARKHYGVPERVEVSATIMGESLF